MAISGIAELLTADQLPFTFFLKDKSVLRFTDDRVRKADSKGGLLGLSGIEMNWG